MTKELNEAAAKLQAKGGIAGSNDEGRRYVQLQTDWDEAFRAFEAATNKFAATVKHLHDDLELRRSTNGPGPNDTSN
jgi:hypothetical protein